jgi:hypothetical protein
MTERVRTLAALFESAKGVEVFAVDDMVQRMWEKLVHLSTAAAMTCDAGECRRDCPHPLWPRSFSRSASLWCGDSRCQRSRAERGLHESVGGDVFSVGLPIFDLDAARHRTGRPDRGGTHPRLCARQGGRGANSLQHAAARLHQRQGFRATAGCRPLALMCFA